MKPTHQAFRKALEKEGFEVLSRNKDDYIIIKNDIKMVLRRDQLHRLYEIYDKMVELEPLVLARRERRKRDENK